MLAGDRDSRPGEGEGVGDLLVEGEEEEEGGAGKEVVEGEGAGHKILAMVAARENAAGKKIFNHLFY